MLEIICLIWLWRVNGKHAIERGQNPKKYRALTLGLWFGLEFTGTFVGAWLMQLLNAGDNAFYGAYFFGIIGAAIHFLLGCKKSTDGKLQTRRPAKWME